VFSFTPLKHYFLGNELLVPTGKKAKLGLRGGPDDMEKI
jgi:hypothetical protein